MLFVIALLFSLTPCKVKASLLESFGITYEQTLNQSKVTSNCHSSSYIAQKNRGSKATVTSIFILDFTSIKTFFLLIEKVVVKQHFSKTISVKSIPKYILYKQFKFDVV